MKFYDHLAKTYDYFIDWEARIKNEDPFFQQIFRESLGNSVLDLGCGTGGYSIYLAELGFNVVGIDSSRQMINAAQARAESEEVDAEFQCLQITDFSNKINLLFDSIICNGNTIAHVLEEAPLLRLFQECVRSMKPTGSAVFHTLNYHRILENKRRDFPVTHRQVGENEYLFVRFYNYEIPFLDFNMVVASKENGHWQSKSMQMKHRPWLKDDLERVARQAGFTNIMCYGGFDFSEFNPDNSDVLIMVCETGDDEVSQYKVKV